MEEPETRGRRIQQPLRIAALPCLGLLLQTQQCKRLQCQPEMTSHLTESPGPGRTPFRRDRTNPDSIQPGPTDSSVSDTEEQKEAQKQDPGPQTLAAGVGSHCSTFCAEPPDPGTKRKASGSPRGQLAPISEDEEKPRKSRVREALASFIRTMGAHGLLEKSASRPLIDFLVRQCTLILDSTEEADRRRTMELEVRQLCSSTLQCLGDSPRMANGVGQATGPLPQELLARLLVLAASSYMMVQVGRAAMFLPFQLISRFQAGSGRCWDNYMTDMLLYPEDHKTCFCQREWEQQLLQFLEDLLFFISDHTWLGWFIASIRCQLPTVISVPVTRSVSWKELGVSA
ncbi:maestro heat-like repeat-containing protein family member 1 isoform X3 [Mauremys reevesii]|uniref:maestro heat-like repeat-containing protein family member 1 isoform X3 n=1 Tax=Mauremys reevesii TaxID=260615 RepID=UPI00193ECCE0|nr:maestro heat-like repeat-containing protein family member 1 isoform X3 [Mauremys reevesii]